MVSVALLIVWQPFKWSADRFLLRAGACVVAGKNHNPTVLANRFAVEPFDEYRQRQLPGPLAMVVKLAVLP